jgi:glycerophosphoryl diester phosphodiesterase
MSVRPRRWGGDVVAAPLLIAHRAGNDPAQLRAAEAAGADVIEADLHLRRGRLELRHLKTHGLLPFYWDRWALAPPWRRFDSLDDLLATARPETVLMLDLKGNDRAAARLVTRTLSSAAGRGDVFVSAREWPLLDEIDPALSRRIASAATPRQLERLIAYGARASLDGAVLHLRLLESTRLRALRECTSLLMSWPINHGHEADRATALGVSGLISDNLALLGALVVQRQLREAAAGAQGVAQRAAQGERAEGDHQRHQADGEVDERHADLQADAEGDDARGRRRLA